MTSVAGSGEAVTSLGDREFRAAIRAWLAQNLAFESGGVERGAATFGQQIQFQALGLPRKPAPVRSRS